MGERLFVHSDSAEQGEIQVRQQMRSRIADGLDRARLLPVADRIRRGWLTRHDDESATDAADGLPLPPSRLRLLVDGRDSDADAFLRVGEEMAGSIQGAAADLGLDLRRAGAILDFGCGCGRVVRHWAGLDGPEVHGCDYNRELIAWCGGNLPFLRVARNGLEPPAPYGERSFDLVYALSVLSHLSELLQHAWIAEFRRLLRPGGLLIVSVLGEGFRGRLDFEQLQRFDRGELVVERPRMAGRNVCTAYHPRRYVTGHLLADFADVRPFDLGPPEWPQMQDAYVARRPLRA